MADYISVLTGSEMDAALLDMAEHNSEAWAVGARNGVPVQSGDETYQNNSKYWAGQAANYIQGDIHGAVRWDVAQSLSAAEKAQARANVGSAPVDSPTFTGTPASTTPASGDSSTKIATTAFVGGAVQSGVQTALNRTTAVNEADTNYTTYMARGESLNATETTPTINGTIAWLYE